ncbi:YqzL family protein [Paenalkalicoccus suaedae]|uniref:YqzL family protein n=1 Tax=Paenalkalicoccus suaedae TaxID=2592382 RepID=A0A859FF66_9BACI|nr:YqzL family protein [Paenalkalicoccus suaedae]
MFWLLFSLTGNIDAYLLYIEAGQFQEANRYYDSKSRRNCNTHDGLRRDK